MSDLEEPVLIEVTIIVDGHTHNGSLIKKGEKITVTIAERDWMANVTPPIFKQRGTA